MTGSKGASPTIPIISRRKFQNLALRLTDSRSFSLVVIVIYCIDGVIIGMETEAVIKKKDTRQFDIAELIIVLSYIIELLLKTSAQPLIAWRNAYYLLEILSLEISLLHVFTKATPEIRASVAGRILAILRTCRVLRLVSFMGELRVVMFALFDIIRGWVINIILLLLLTMFIFSVSGYYFYGQQESGDKENWGTLSRAMYTLFSFVNVDGWTDLQADMDTKNLPGSRIFTITFILLGHFLFTNIFLGVIIMNIHDSREENKRVRELKRQQALQAKKECMMEQQRETIVRLRARQRKGMHGNFNKMVSDFKGNLHHNDWVMVSDLMANVIWMETFIQSLAYLEHTSYKLQQLHFEMSNLLTESLNTTLKKGTPMAKSEGSVPQTTIGADVEPTTSISQEASQKLQQSPSTNRGLEQE